MTIEFKTHMWDGAENLETRGDVRLMTSNPNDFRPLIFESGPIDILGYPK
jgi:hypothetical protein